MSLRPAHPGECRPRPVTVGGTAYLWPAVIPAPGRSYAQVQSRYRLTGTREVVPASGTDGCWPGCAIQRPEQFSYLSALAGRNDSSLPGRSRSSRRNWADGSDLGSRSARTHGSLQMNETCDRCGPAVRAAYRVHKRGELYLCRHRAARLWRTLSAHVWTRAAGGPEVHPRRPRPRRVRRDVREPGVSPGHRTVGPGERPLRIGNNRYARKHPARSDSLIVK